jgi:hypothetical protein
MGYPKHKDESPIMQFARRLNENPLLLALVLYDDRTQRPTMSRQQRQNHSVNGNEKEHNKFTL